MSRRPVSTTEFLQDYVCSITLAYPFIDPLQVTPCGHLFDKKSFNTYLQGQTRPTCPYCRGDIVLSGDAPSIIKNALSFGLSQDPELYKDVHFDIDQFADVVRKNKLNTPIGERFILVLEHADNYFNDAMGILATTLAGRDLLRKKLSIDASSGKFKFGRAEISAESLQILVNGKSIREWLSITTAIEMMQDEELKARQGIGAEAQIITLQLKANFQRMLRSHGFFAANCAAAPMDQRHSHPAVNEILQNVIRGNKEAVRIALENLRTENPDLLRIVLIATATQPITDYSNRAIVDQTLLQAATCAGDVAINPGESEMCEMIASYLHADEVAAQFTELFPDGIEAHEIEQQRNTFNFGTIFEAIRAASTADLDAALNKIGAKFTESDSARAKPDHKLSLTEALNRFREQFAQRSHSEKIFNPEHLRQAFEVYNVLWDQCECDDNDRDYKERDLFWRQIIGYTQRFMPACYVQAFAQGLYYLVKVDRDASWRPEPFNRVLKLKRDNFSYFPLAHDSRSGFGFDFAIYGQLGASAVGMRGSWCWGEAKFFKNFCRAKTAGFQNITPRAQVFVPAESNKSRCVIQ